MTNLYINYFEFDEDRVLPFEKVERDSKPKINPKTGQIESQKFYTVSLQYRYKVLNKKTNTHYESVGPLNVRFPQVKTTQGIVFRNQDLPKDRQILPYQSYMSLMSESYEGKLSASISVRFDMNNDSQKELVDVFYTKLTNLILERIFSMKGEFKMPSSIKSVEHLTPLFKEPIYYPQDSNGEIVLGSSPSKFFTLLSIGKPGSFSRKETKFNYPVKNDRGEWEKENWKNLCNVEMEFVPEVCFQSLSILSTNMIYLKDILTEATIDSIIPANSISRQDDLLENKATDFSHIQKLKDQRALLMQSFSEKKPESEEPVFTQPPPVPVPEPVVAEMPKISTPPKKDKKPKEVEKEAEDSDDEEKARILALAKKKEKARRRAELTENDD